jgi:cephalosporin hydroxylase
LASPCSFNATRAATLSGGIEIIADSFSPAQALWNNRDLISDKSRRFADMHRAIGYDVDLDLPQLAQWFAVAMEFKPDVIVELGRHYGNSTCTFVEAANHLTGCRVVSLCLTDDWQRHSRARVAKVVEPEWFRPLDARVGDILATDYDDILQGAKRVLVLWDAHGYAVAGCVLGAILPKIRSREHLVIMHDVCDTRYGEWDLKYGDQKLWKGSEPIEGSFLLGHLYSYVEQTISAVDFTSRNHLPLRTFGESLYTDLSELERTRLQQKLADLYSPKSYWAWLSLNELTADAPVSFPQFSRVEPTRFDPHAPLAPTKDNIDKLQAVIAFMEGSPLWKLRNRLQPVKPFADPWLNRFRHPR